MKKSKGFTLVELMVVIVIIGILAALAIPKLLAATSKAKLSEFKSVLKSAYTLEETHFQEAGSYTNDATAIGFSTPGGKANFDYKITIADASTDTAAETMLASAITKSGVSIKLSDGTAIAASTQTACVDVKGIQYGASDLIAKDAGLSKAGSGYYSSTKCTK